MDNTVKQPGITLKPEDFIAPVWAALIDIKERAMLPRVRIVMRQEVIFFEITETSIYKRVDFYDREDDGERLDVWVNLSKPQMLYLAAGMGLRLTVHWVGEEVYRQ